MSYYEGSRPWPAVGQNSWNDLDIDSQTVRSGASSTVPSQAPPPPAQGQEGLPFYHQLEGMSDRPTITRKKQDQDQDPGEEGLLETKDIG